MRQETTHRTSTTSNQPLLSTSWLLPFPGLRRLLRLIMRSTRQGRQGLLLHLMIVMSMASWTIYMGLSLSISTSAQSNQLDQPIIITSPQLDLPSLDELTRNPERLTCFDPLLPIQDRIVRNVNNPTTPTRRIPRVIHVSFKSRCLPPEMYDAMEVWKTALPHHSFYFHDDQAVDRLFALSVPEFPQLKSLMRCVLSRGAMKVRETARTYFIASTMHNSMIIAERSTSGEVSETRL